MSFRKRHDNGQAFPLGQSGGVDSTGFAGVAASDGARVAALESAQRPTSFLSFTPYYIGGYPHTKRELMILTNLLDRGTFSKPSADGLDNHGENLLKLGLIAKRKEKDTYGNDLYGLTRKGQRVAQIARRNKYA